MRGTTYHIVANPTVHQQLYEELKTAIPDVDHPPPPQILEQLPYLSAVVNEGLRLADPITHRLMREFPDKDLTCHGFTIPRGTGVGMTAYLVHRNEEIFANPQQFRPERWLGEDNKNLKNYLIPFSRGTRVCPGMNLARAELFSVLAAVFREFDFDITQVSRERDIDVNHDYIVAAPAANSPGVLVKVKKV